MTEGRDEDEWRKRLTAKLRNSPQFLLIDNLHRRLDSTNWGRVVGTGGVLCWCYRLSSSWNRLISLYLFPFSNSWRTPHNLAHWSNGSCSGVLSINQSTGLYGG